MLSSVQHERLGVLHALVLLNTHRYDHSVFKSVDGKACAAGLAVEHRHPHFPGLGLEFREPVGEGVLERCGYEFRDMLDNRTSGTQELELYFGEGAWEGIFGLYEGKIAGQYPTAVEVADRILNFMNQGTTPCAAKQLEGCSPPTEQVRNF